MTIEELKKSIEEGTVSDSLLILKCEDNTFLADHYINQIASVKGKKIEYTESIDGFLTETEDLFGSIATLNPDSLTVFKCNTFIWSSKELLAQKSIVIVTSKFESKSLEDEYKSVTVTMPKLEEWQIRDYVYSLLDGVDKKKLDYFMNLCKGSIHRLQSEMDKVSIFRPEERKFVFDDCMDEGALDDLSNYSIFTFTNAVVAKDISSIKNIYQQLDRMDVNGFGLLTILLNNFRNILTVQLTPYPTPENTGIDGKKLYAIKNIPKVYSPKQLVSIVSMLDSIDYQVKSGLLPAEMMLDYMMLKILTV